jgi:hypothetical protein
MSFSEYSGHVPRCQHIKTNGIQCGSPALHRGRFCYFHHRWRTTAINLKRASTARSASVLELPVLEDANSIQVALTQIMRLILGRQLDHKTGGLILYGLQIASANQRHTSFEPLHKPQVIVDPRSVAETGVGEDAWAPEDFEEEAADCVARAPSPAKGVTSNSARPPLPASAEIAEEQESKGEQQSNPTQIAAKPTRTIEANHNAPQNGSAEAVTHPDESNHLQCVQSALQGAQLGNLRDLKTFFALTGIYPPKLDPASPSVSESK